MKCPKCQNELRNNAKFCTRCGSKLDGMSMQPEFYNMQPGQGMRSVPQMPAQSTCAVCGAPLLDGVKFCTRCGSRIEKTAVLTPSLIRRKDNMVIKVVGTEFTIGKNPELVNYCISDNLTVSRTHAKIINRNGQFYIVDMNSKNHTYVNDAMIPSNVEVQIGNGAKIRFSNDEYQFVM